MNRKFITIKTEEGVELIFTFPDAVAHIWMLEAVHTVKQGGPQNWIRPYGAAPCISAGFVMNGTCYGHSESLNIGARLGGLDTALLARGGMS